MLADVLLCNSDDGVQRDEKRAAEQYTQVAFETGCVGVMTQLSCLVREGFDARKASPQGVPVP